MNCAANCNRFFQLELAAWTALDDLQELQRAFENARAVFVMIIDKTPAGHISNDLAQLGIADLTEWRGRLDVCTGQLESSLGAAADADNLNSLQPGA